MSPPATFIWTDKTSTGRNRYVLFRRSFSLLGPTSGSLNIFADTRYRLIVNGHTLGHGPARFFTSKPEYDSYDLTPYLSTGRNAIAIIVNSYACLSFHSQTSIGSLIAWGAVSDKTGHTIPIATDDSWRAIESPAHHPQTPYLSFALNPGEFLDARAIPRDWDSPNYDDREWPFAVPCRRQEHWGPLWPRSIPPLDERPIFPRRRLDTFAARKNPDEQIHSLILTTSTGRSLHTLAKVTLFTYIHSPRDQKITFGAFWGRYWINGNELKGDKHPHLPLRQDFSASLTEGWNALLVYDTMKSDWWDFYLALPTNAHLAISAEKLIDSPHTFLVGGPWEDNLADEADHLNLPLTSPADLPAGLGGWKPWPRENSANTPCRERAWKTFEKISDDPALHVHVPDFAKTIAKDTLVLLYDFGSEVLGRPTLHFSAASGTILDLTYSERLKSDGSSDLHARRFVDMAERYIARKGPQQYQTFHPRGFRYLELLITGDLCEFNLHQLTLTRANYPVQPVGSFECSDPALNEIWLTGQKTLYACMEDAYLDCPWRERGLYAGDFLIQYLVNLACFGDTQLFRRCIELFLLSQDETGLISPGAHGLPPGRHPDYSAIIPQTIWQYYATTGDADFLKQMLPRLKRLMKGLLALRDQNTDLLDGSSLEPYLDLCHMDRTGLNCALNCFYQRAFSDAARIMTRLNLPDLAQSYSQIADRLASAIRLEFWNPQQNIFTDRRPADVPTPSPSVPANALPILYDIEKQLPHPHPQIQRRLQRHLLLLFLRPRRPLPPRPRPRSRTLHPPILVPPPRPRRLDLVGVLPRRHQRLPLPRLVRLPNPLPLHPNPRRIIPRPPQPQPHPHRPPPWLTPLGPRHLPPPPRPHPHQLATPQRPHRPRIRGPPHPANHHRP
ncbi:MAG: family 78 glycoside hydrolase catalytic domain, partial [Planctomycetota bacterium]|nr:family 78 glycoside hydrolase catalytic domain [Planctomycetota bacterium]